MTTTRRALLKGAAATATAAAASTLGAPMIWAQNIKDVTLRQFGTGVSNLNEVGQTFLQIQYSISAMSKLSGWVAARWVTLSGVSLPLRKMPTILS